MSKKKLPKFKTSYNYEEFSPAGEINKEPSLTVPNQSYTIQEILLRFTTGIPPAVSQPYYYESDQEDIDFDSYNPANAYNIDLADVTNAIHNAEHLRNVYKTRMDFDKESSNISKEKKPKKETSLESQFDTVGKSSNGSEV